MCNSNSRPASFVTRYTIDILYIQCNGSSNIHYGEHMSTVMKNVLNWYCAQRPGWYVFFSHTAIPKRAQIFDIS